MLAGGIATVLQRNIGLDSFSLEGFAFFMLVFIIISFLWGFIFKDKEQEEVKQSKEEIEENKRVNKYYGSLFKKFVLIVISLAILNIVVNFSSYKLGLFDDEFKYRFDTSKAISLNLKDKKPVKIFEWRKYFYFLYKYEDKYYLVKQKDSIMKDGVLTLYSSFGYLENIFDFIKERDDFYNIVDNLSPTVYEEVSFTQMFYKPLWFSNSINRIYWSSSENKEIKEKYNKYLNQKKYEKIKQKQEEYKKLLNKDLKTISDEELKQTINKLYSIHAFTRDTRYAISLLDEAKNRDIKDKDINLHQMNLISYLYLYRTKARLNDILKSYDMGAVYTFTFLDRQPLDIPKQKYSHVRFVDLSKKTRVLLWGKRVKDIKSENENLIIEFNNGQKISYKFKKEDTKQIKLKLNAMISTVYSIERNFNMNK